MQAAIHHGGRTPCPADRAACPRCCGSMFPLAVSYVASVSHSSYSIMSVSSCVLLGSHIASFFILKNELPVMRYVPERLVVLTLERLGLILGMYKHSVLPCRSARAPMYIPQFHLNTRNTLRRVTEGITRRDPCSIGSPTRSSSCRLHRVSRLYGSQQRNKSYPAPLTPLANSLSTTSSFR